MAALHRITGIESAIATAIEVVVCTLGFLTGGKIGVGTLIFAGLVGQAVPAIAFGVIGRLGAVTPVEQCRK
jgi:uncharacterized membrane protein YczE